jgi:hypothetical protein
MPTDSELRQMALDITDTAYLRLIDEIYEDILNEDRLLGGLTGRGSASRHELPRRLEAIYFGTPLPPEVFATRWGGVAPTDL